MGWRFIAINGQDQPGAARTDGRPRRIQAAGLRDAADGYFWIDPFSPEGQRLGPSCGRSRASCACTPSAPLRSWPRPGPRQAQRIALWKIRRRWTRWSWARDASILWASNFRQRTRPRRSTARRCRCPPTRATGTRWRRSCGPSDRTTGSWKTFATATRCWADSTGRRGCATTGLTGWRSTRPVRPRYATVGWPGDRWNLLLEQWWNTHTLPAATDAGLPDLTDK